MQSSVGVFRRAFRESARILTFSNKTLNTCFDVTLANLGTVLIIGKNVVSEPGRGKVAAFTTHDAHLQEPGDNP
jgi:hypothetical protein